MKNLQELTNEELLFINGGDGFWYDVAYLVGAGARHLYDGIKAGKVQQVQQRW